MKRLLMFATLAVASITVLSGPAAVSAKPDTTTKKPKQETIIVTVKAGETLTSIAERYKTTYARIFDANKSISHPDQIDIGDKVRIPTKKEKLPNRMAAVAAAGAPQQQIYTGSIASAPAGATPVYKTDSNGNTYYAGYCTWYAKSKRPDLPNMLGNGGQWTANAAARGYKTGSTPRAGAIAESPGHVTYVEKVYGDGTMLISEMNGQAGFGKVGTRRVPTSNYSYIY